MLEQYSEKERLAAHVLEEDDSLETRNNLAAFMLEEPVSHYECSWAAGDGDPIYFVWEDEEDIEGDPDYIGCEVCGVMVEPDMVVGGDQMLEAREYLGQRPSV